MATTRTPTIAEATTLAWANHFEAASVSQLGSYHEQNEDRALYSQHFFGVADGVGGGANGDIAAETLIDYCANIQNWQDAQQLQQALMDSDIVVQQALQQLGSEQGASTLAAAWLNPQGQGFIASVGDVRLYHLQPQASQVKLSQLTIDQTYDYMGECSPSGQQDAPARMIGSGAVGQPPVQAIHLQANEALLILTDGVYRFLSLEQLTDICQSLNHQQSLNQICQQLVATAIEQGSYDDATALMVRLKPITPPIKAEQLVINTPHTSTSIKPKISLVNCVILTLCLLLALLLGFYLGQQNIY